MSGLTAVACPDGKQAVESLDTLRRVRYENLLGLEDALYVTKNRHGKRQLYQSVDPTATGAAHEVF